MTHRTGASGTSHFGQIDGYNVVAGNHFHGPAEFTFNPPPERAETKPLSTVPFRRDPDFVDRGDFLDQIAQRCAQPAGRAALVGLGGVGKSQLAIELAHRIRDSSPDTWVFWVHASSAARFEQGYREIAGVAKIPGRNNPQANIFKLVHDWLVSFLVEVPAVDQVGAVGQSQSSKTGRKFVVGPLREYLSQSQNGSILVTTRNRAAAKELVDTNEIILVNPMDEADALELLDKKLEPSMASNRQDKVELVAALESMPLAIVQAAAYISQLAPRYSVRRYIEEFNRSDRKKSSLLNYKEGYLRRDGEAKNSIIITWQISFEYIHNTRQSAAELLSLMSFFDSQGIPEILLRDRSGEVAGETYGGENEEDNSDEDNSDEDDSGEGSLSDLSANDGFETDVRILRDFSFISLTADPTVFEMHKLVQLATRQWLEASQQVERWKQQYIRNLQAEFPTGDYENWTKCAALFPHVQSAITQKPKDRDSLLSWATVLYSGAGYAWQRGDAVGALEMSRRSMKTRKKMLGDEDPATLNGMNLLGLALNKAGRWREAEKLFVQVMETRKRVLDEDHPDMLASMNNLASTYMNQGRWEEAEKLFMQVMETFQTKLRADHPDTLISMGNLASTYRKQGRWREAENLQMPVMETGKRVLGEDHPSTLTSMASLASTYRDQGRWEEAEKLFIQVMETRKTKLGANHPSTLISMANLASTFWNQGRWREAEELGAQVTETRKRVLGEDHPSTLTSMHNLAHTWKSQGRDSDALALMEGCAGAQQRILGPKHPYTLSSLKTLEAWISFDTDQ